MAKTNALFYGDNLVWLRDHKYFPSESVDLIYLDPPFNSKADYNVIFNEPGKVDKSQAQIQAFDDTWHWDSEASEIALNELAQNKPQIAELISWLSRQGKTYESIAAYLSMLAVRLIELHRVLKPTGSLYLHCDPTASHYIKIVLDEIFTPANFRNEIIWCYRQGGRSNRIFGRKHETIFFFTKTGDWLFNADAVRIPYHGTGGYQTSGKGVTISGKVYKPHPEGKITEDWWDIPSLPPMDKERLGYPTQKPLALMERIIGASSPKKGTVLDPFCGCGTTIDAAQHLERHWLGIDVTWLAIDLVEKRLKATYGSKVIDKYQIHGKPYDVASAQALANKNKKEFEIWAISLVGAAPREHDSGVDGIFGFVEQDKRTRTIIVQVKGGDVLNPGMVRDLIGTVRNENAAIGLLITLREPTAGMKNLSVHSDRYKSELWNKEFPSIQIRTIGELLEGKGFDLPPTQSPFRNAQLSKEKGRQISQDI
jgi:site-specific DNA-methyltransferase (adenine-specific)